MKRWLPRAAADFCVTWYKLVAFFAKTYGRVPVLAMDTIARRKPCNNDDKLPANKVLPGFAAY